MFKRFVMLVAALTLAGACSSDGGRESIGTADDPTEDETETETDDESTTTEETTTTTEAEEKAPDVVIVEHGYSAETVSYDESQQRVVTGVVVRNDGNATAYEVEVSVTALSDGRALDTGTDTLSFLEPGETGFVSTEHLMPAEPAVTGIDVTGSSRAEESFMAVPEIVFPVSDVRVAAESFGGSVRGQMTSNIDEVADSLQVNCIVRGGEGQIIGGGFTYTESIAAGATVAFEVSVSETIAVAASGAECRASATNITTVG